MDSQRDVNAVSTAGAARLALGSAQFGLSYGIANTRGRIAHEEALAILEEARRAGIDTIDTAAAYGDSERVLGELGTRGLRVVTKLPAIPKHIEDVAAWVDRSVAESIARLRVPRLYGLLLHRPQDLLTRRGDRLYQSIQRVQASGLVKKIGVSVYGPDELDALLPAYPVDLVQAPFSVLDRRLEVSGWMQRLKEQRVELHSRSAFLQGVLLMPAGARPRRFERWQPIWRAWHQWLDETGLSALQACLGFVLAHPEIDRLVVGVDGSSHFSEVVAAARLSGAVLMPPSELSSDDLDLIDPSRWNA